MRALLTILIGTTAILAGGCGDANERPASSAGTPAGAAPKDTGLVAARAIAGCAGFTPAKVADILGAAAADITDNSRDQGSLRFCAYGSSTDRSKQVSFTLGRRDSVAAAVASLKREREALGDAQGAIDRVTKSPSSQAASADVSGIGDEAFYSPMNGAIMLRVGNVLAQVMSPADLALKKRVAQEVARGLRP